MNWTELPTAIVDRRVYDRAVAHMKAARVALPTFAELADPSAIPASIGYNRIGAAYARLGQDMASFVEERALALLSRPAAVARDDEKRRRAETP